MMVFKRKQIVVLSLVLMIIVAGYLQYSYKKSSTASENDKGKLGEAVYVENEEASNDKSNKQNGTTQKDISASKQANDYFAQAKLDREVTRSKDIDTLKEISTDINATNEVKAQAYEKMMKIVDNSEMEMRIEALIKEKGFEDVITFFAEDGSLDIIIKSPSLNSSQTAQIADIVLRHAKIDMDKIHIRNIY